MSHHQQTFLRQQRRVAASAVEAMDTIEAVEALLDYGFSVEKVGGLLRGQLHAQGNVSVADRVREARDMGSFMTEELRFYARRGGAVWHAMLEPAQDWAAERLEREDFLRRVKEYMEAPRSHGAWPSVSLIRSWYGKAPTRRRRGDTPGQETLVPSGPEDNAGVYSDADPGL